MAKIYKKDGNGITRIIRTGEDLIKNDRLELNEKIRSHKGYLLSRKAVREELVDSISDYALDMEILQLKVGKIRLRMQPLEKRLDKIEKSIADSEKFLSDNKIYDFDKEEETNEEN